MKTLPLILAALFLIASAERPPTLSADADAGPGELDAAKRFAWEGTLSHFTAERTTGGCVLFWHLDEFGPYWIDVHLTQHANGIVIRWEHSGKRWPVTEERYGSWAEAMRKGTPLVRFTVGCFHRIGLYAKDLTDWD